MIRTIRVVLATGIALALAVPMSAAVAEAAPATGGSSDVSTDATTTTVRAGDSLVGIAHRFGVRLSALLRANSMTLTSVIHPGDTIVIPAGVSIPRTAPRAASTTTGGSTGTAATSAYVVRPGDALAGIAWRNGVTLGALVEANDLTVASVIFPGQTLTVPPATRTIPASRTTSTPASVAAPARTTGPSVGSAASGSVDTLLAYLREQIGKPYEFFSAGPATFDCSGLVVAGFRRLGMSVPHQSRALARLGTEINWRTAPIVAGDLVFTSAVDDPAQITHVGVALDSRTWIHAVGRGRTVSVGSLPSTDRIMAVRRLPLP